MENGYIYILINPALQKDYLKIGMTNRTPEVRAKEISNGTGIPAEFQVAYEARVPDCASAEKVVHANLDKFRLKDNREFFILPLKEAIAEIEKVREEVYFLEAEKIMQGLDKVLGVIRSNEYDVSKDLVGGLLASYLNLRNYTEMSVGMIFRVALVALVFSNLLGEDELELKEKVAEFAQDNFNQVIAASYEGISCEEIVNTLYFLPYHAYINRILALLSLNRIGEARQVCGILQVRLKDKELEGNIKLRQMLEEQHNEIVRLVNSYHDG